MTAPRRSKTGQARGRLGVAVVTGTRAEFGILRPVIDAMMARPELDVRLIVTGVHLLKRFGRTIDQIRAAGYRVDATVRMQTGRSLGEEAAALGRGVSGIDRVLDDLACDAVMVLGDRIEALAGACAGIAARKAVLHIHGGDRAPGDIDDQVRNAISRLAHVHLVASADAAKRLGRMGEPTERIKVVGAPGLDQIRAWRTAGGRPCKYCGEQGYAVLLQHPIGRSDAVEATVAKRIAAALNRRELPVVAIYPSSDPGSNGIVGVLDRQGKRPDWVVLRSLPSEVYLSTLAGARVLIGNSSSGIIESASLGVNVVNVGPRQAGRLRCGPNVIDADETDRSIRAALDKTLARPRPRPSQSVYGDGRAAERIARIVARLRVSRTLLRKDLQY